MKSYGICLSLTGLFHLGSHLKWSAIKKVLHTKKRLKEYNATKQELQDMLKELLEGEEEERRRSRRRRRKGGREKHWYICKKMNKYLSIITLNVKIECYNQKK